jgi:hypothetical protein
VAVDTFIGRLGQHVFAKGCQRMRYAGVQAPKTLAKRQGGLQAALAKEPGFVTGALKIIAPLHYRQRDQQSMGRAPLRCPHCQVEMAGWKRWHPKYGGIYSVLHAWQTARVRASWAGVLGLPKAARRAIADGRTRALPVLACGGSGHAEVLRPREVPMPLALSRHGLEPSAHGNHVGTSDTDDVAAQ